LLLNIKHNLSFFQTRLSKILSIKKEWIKKLRNMNTEAEKKVSDVFNIDVNMCDEPLVVGDVRFLSKECIRHGQENTLSNPLMSPGSNRALASAWGEPCLLETSDSVACW
jgi:hypothetical protein